MKGVLINAQQGKAWKRKEKRIMLIYVGAILFAVLFLFLLAAPKAVSPELELPGLVEPEPGSKDLIVYYTMFTLTLVISLIAFGVYFIKSRRTHAS